VWHINRIPVPHFEADDQNLRPEDLRVENRRKKDQASASEAMEWTAETVVETLLTEDLQSSREIEASAKTRGISQREIKGLLAVAVKRGLAVRAGGTGRTPLMYGRATVIPSQTGVV
jgi:hypothetical protein